MIIHKDGKPHVKCIVHELPAQGESLLAREKSTGKLYNAATQMVSYFDNQDDYHELFNLYFLSDRDFKPGDNILRLSTGEIERKLQEREIKGGRGIFYETDWKVIEATTDHSVDVARPSNTLMAEYCERPFAECLVPTFNVPSDDTMYIINDFDHIPVPAEKSWSKDEILDLCLKAFMTGASSVGTPYPSQIWDDFVKMNFNR